MALQIAAKGLEIEMELTVSTFNKLLAACARDGSTDEGVSAFKLLQKSGQIPDEEYPAPVAFATPLRSVDLG